MSAKSITGGSFKFVEIFFLSCTLAVAFLPPAYAAQSAITSVSPNPALGTTTGEKFRLSGNRFINSPNPKVLLTGPTAQMDVTVSFSILSSSPFYSILVSRPEIGRRSSWAIRDTSLEVLHYDLLLTILKGWNGALTCFLQSCHSRWE
jgi:hypothetical protein